MHPGLSRLPFLPSAVLALLAAGPCTGSLGLPTELIWVYKHNPQNMGLAPEFTLWPP